MPRKLLFKEFLLSEFSTSHNHLISLLAQLNEGQMLEPITNGLWSVKDILDHLTAWDKLGKPIPIAELVHWRLQHLASHSKPIEWHVVMKMSTNDSTRTHTQ